MYFVYLYCALQHDVVPDLGTLLSQIEGKEVWGWIANRIKATWSDWVGAAWTLHRNQTKTQRTQKRVGRYYSAISH